MSVSVCLSVCLCAAVGPANVSPELGVRSSPKLPVSVARTSSCCVAIRYAFPVSLLSELTVKAAGREPGR